MIKRSKWVKQALKIRETSFERELKKFHGGMQEIN